MNKSRAYAKIYVFYCSALVRTVRLLTAVLLALVIYADFSIGVVPRIPLFLLTVYLMLETFVVFKVARIAPSAKVSDVARDDPDPAFSQLLTYKDLSTSSAQTLLGELIKLPQCRFILERIGVRKEEFKPLQLEKKLLYEKAYDLAFSLKGKYITTMDVIVAYLLLTEEQTKLLFDHKVTERELMDILHWAGISYPDEEETKKIRVNFGGEGFADSLISGWTPETQKYTSDFSSEAIRKRQYIFGRDEDYKKICDALLGNVNNNVLIVGNVGSGKETLVKTLAYDSYSGKLEGTLSHRRIFELLVGPLIAGMTDRGALETRLQSIITEISHSGNVLLYIPEFQNVLGSSSYSLDLSGALLPYLRDGKVPVIATMTRGEYKTYVENNPIKQVFQVIELKEPEERVAIQMLMQKTLDLEIKYGLIITYDTLKSAVTYADRYIMDTSLPGSAAKLLEDVCGIKAQNKVKGENFVLPDDVIKMIEDKAHVKLSEPKAEEKQVLLHLEDKLHERVIDQVQAISAIAEAMRRIRTGLASGTKPVSFLFLGPTGVGKTETAKALSALTFGGEDRMLRFDMSEYASEEGLARLLGAAPGKGSERGELTERIREQPSSLVLLDEFEKANPLILNLFLQVLEDGRLTDNKGQTASFLNAIIIATSNAGSEMIRQAVLSGEKLDKAFHAKLLDSLQKSGQFKPELLNRFDDVIIFSPLGQQELGQIAKLLLDDLAKRLKEQDIEIIFDEKVIAKIAQDGSDVQFGARPLRRYIQDNIEDRVAQMKLSDSIKRGSIVHVSVDAANNLTMVVG